MACLIMKFLIDSGENAIMATNQAVAFYYYNTSLEIQKWKKKKKTKGTWKQLPLSAFIKSHDGGAWRLRTPRN